MAVNELLGQRIKVLRCARNYTQEYMADRIGVSMQKYARIENGKDSITLDILSKAASVLGISVENITDVLEETESAACTAQKEGSSSKKILDMLDLFYANKHMYERLRQQ